MLAHFELERSTEKDEGDCLMEFPKSVTIEACEKFITKVSSNEGDQPLMLPIGNARYAFGGLASAIQAVNSWVRASDRRSLVLRSSDVKDEVEELLIRPHKFVAAMSAKSITIEGEPYSELRPQVNAAAKIAVETQAASRNGQQRGGLCWFAFVDHSSKGFDRNFYIERSDAKPKPRQPEQFRAVIGSMVEKATGVSGGAMVVRSQHLDYLGRIFFELFINTHEHGARGLSRSEWLKPGVRVLYVQGINLSEAGASNATEKQPVLNEYVERVAKDLGAGQQRRFVEIGIVDAGLGYCGRWRADHPPADENESLSLVEEYAIFKKCFRFRQTSTVDDSKGNGLPVVMDKLTKLRGFMRVRSGRLAMYRDFLSSPYSLNDPCIFFDWTSGQSAEHNLTPMSQTSGVAISLLIPLEDKR